MTILITGSRSWKNRRQIVHRLLKEPDGTMILEGGADGADMIAQHAARALGLIVTTVRADWQSHGRSAGPIRNRRMLDMQPDKVIAFCRNESAGTMDCVRQARERGIPVELIAEEE